MNLLVRCDDGIWRQKDSVRRVEPFYACSGHHTLPRTGDRRCVGCGRTANEIELDKPSRRRRGT